MIDVTTKPRGVDETLALLAGIDEKLKKATVEEMASAAAPMVAAVSAAIPHEPPLSGFARGRLAWGPHAWSSVGHTVGGKQGADKPGKWRLFSVVVFDGGAQVFDMAGSRSTGKTASGQGMIAALNARYGGPSRRVWPAAYRASEGVKKAVAAALEKAEATISAELTKTGG